MLARPIYTVKARADPGSTLSDGLEPSASLREAFKIDRSEHAVTQRIDSHNGALRQMGWIVQFDAGGDRDNVLLTYRRHYVVIGDDVDESLSRAASDGFQDAPEQYDAVVEFGPDQTILTISLAHPVRRSHDGSLDLPGTRDSRQLAVSNIPSVMLQQVPDVDAILEDADLDGPYRGVRWIGEWQSDTVFVDIWPIRESADGGLGPIVEIASRGRDRDASLARRDQLTIWLRQHGWNDGVHLRAGDHSAVVPESSLSGLSKRSGVSGPSRSSRPSADAPLYVDENVQFTVYRPERVRPQVWYSMLAFAHLSEAPPGSGEPDPVAEVRRQAEQALGAAIDQYRNTSQDSAGPVPREGELTFVPLVPGVIFNPPQRSFFWQESVQREDFRLRASHQLDGLTARGCLTVFLGRIILAEVNLTIGVDSSSEDVRASRALIPASAGRYRRIFPSYSRRDSGVVAEARRFARAFGDEYMQDVFTLRSGEVWDERLRELIDSADVFQLFWSRNSMRSDFVRKEWEYALSLDRPRFIRPIYWEHPMPKSESPRLPPPALAEIQFHRLRTRIRARQTRARSDRHRQPRPNASDEQPPVSAVRAGRDAYIGVTYYSYGSPTSLSRSARVAYLIGCLLGAVVLLALVSYIAWKLAQTFW